MREGDGVDDVVSYDEGETFYEPFMREDWFATNERIKQGRQILLDAGFGVLQTSLEKFMSLDPLLLVGLSRPVTLEHLARHQMDPNVAMDMGDLLDRNLFGESLVSPSFAAVLGLPVTQQTILWVVKSGMGRHFPDTVALQLDRLQALVDSFADRVPNFLPELENLVRAAVTAAQAYSADPIGHRAAARGAIQAFQLKMRLFHDIGANLISWAAQNVWYMFDYRNRILNQELNYAWPDSLVVFEAATSITLPVLPTPGPLDDNPAPAKKTRQDEGGVKQRIRCQICTKRMAIKQCSDCGHVACGECFQ